MRAHLSALALAQAVAAASCASSRSIYRTPELEAAALNGYSARLAGWPVPVESRYLGTSYGPAHVLITGPAEAPPVLVLHAMGVTSTMWRLNVAELSRARRVHFLDFIGDVGRSRLWTDRYPEDGEAVAAWLVEVLDGLGLSRVDLVGASYGGWASLQLASHHPERVGKVALLGPMGVAKVTGEVVRRVASLLLFPSAAKKQEMVSWTLGEDEVVRREFEAHMLEAMECQGRLATPDALPAEQLGKVRGPVLLMLGERDPLTGSPEVAVQRAKAHLPSVETRVLGAGHMMNVERAAEVNAALADLLGR